MQFRDKISQSRTPSCIPFAKAFPIEPTLQIAHCRIQFSSATVKSHQNEPIILVSVSYAKSLGMREAFLTRIWIALLATMESIRILYMTLRSGHRGLLPTLLSSTKGQSSVPTMSALLMIDVMKRAEFRTEVILVSANINLRVLVLSHWLYVNFNSSFTLTPERWLPVNGRLQMIRPREDRIKSPIICLFYTKQGKYRYEKEIRGRGKG
jgi:hypothetical protein